MDSHHGSDRVGGGSASLGDAQSANPSDDPEMLTDTEAFDADTDFEGEAAPVEERGNEDPAPNAP